MDVAFAGEAPASNGHDAVKMCISGRVQGGAIAPDLFPSLQSKENFIMKTSIKALVLALSMIAGSSFAASDISAVTDLANTGAFADVSTTSGLIAGLVLDGSSDDNLAVIAQFGTAGNYATIDQTGAAGNAAVIIQDSAASLNSAAIIQNGAMNSAKINQR